MAADGALGYPGDRGQRGPDQAPLRQPLRHRPVHARRHPARDEPPASPGGTSSSPATAGSGEGSPRGWTAMGAHVAIIEIDPIARPRGAHGRLPGHDRRAGRARGATSSSPRPATSTSSGASTSSAMRDGAIMANCGHFDAELDLVALRADGRGPRPRGPRQRPGVRHRGQAAEPHRGRSAREPRRRRGPPGGGHGHELRQPGPRSRVRRAAPRRARERRSTACPRPSTPRSPG